MKNEEELLEKAFRDLIGKGKGKSPAPEAMVEETPPESQIVVEEINTPAPEAIIVEENKAEGQSPQIKPFVVRLPIDLHRRLKIASVTKGISMKELSARAIAEYLNSKDSQ